MESETALSQQWFDNWFPYTKLQPPQLGGSYIIRERLQQAVAMANVAGWIGIRADDLATALIIGLAPFFLSLAARGGWMPSWLAVWGYLAGIVGLLSTVVYLIPSLAGMGLLIVPVGMGWMIAAGIVLPRQK